MPGVQKYWDKFYKVARELSLYYGFETLETPVLEFADLFKILIKYFTFLFKESR